MGLSTSPISFRSRWLAAPAAISAPDPAHPYQGAIYPAIAYLSGDDFTVLPYIACGGQGVISVIGNIAPRAMKELVVAARRGDLARALDKQVAMAELNRMMFVETNPGPVKAAVALLGKATGELRLPLAPVKSTVAGVVAALGAMAERPDSTPLLPRIDVPTLLVAGAEDTFSPAAEMGGMAAAIPDAEFVTLAGVAHLSCMEDPRGFNAALTRFLTRIRSA